MDAFEQRLKKEQLRREEQGLVRDIISLQPAGAGNIVAARHSFVNLAGNDYLGLGSNQWLIAEFYEGLTPENRLELFAAGSGASRLMTGSHPGYQELEENLARLYGTGKALVFNSGYHLNIGLLPALAGKDDLILADKLCHASLIDGMQLSRAKVIRYPHLDYGCIEGLLGKYRDEYTTIFIVSESIFSMDGDLADLPLLTSLKEKYGAVLYLDEAHAVGVRGERGLGLAEEQGVADKVDLLVGTFGKAWAGQGAFVACTNLVYDHLVNTARSLIFTTALPRISIHWLNFLLPKITAMAAERELLLSNARLLRQGLQENGLITEGDSQIVPVIIGRADLAVAVANQLRQHGFWINAVRPPTVPQGTSRLRLSVTTDLSSELLASLPQLIAETAAAL
ncbi:MAG: 8-amino-7-oxononanoate synthase [Desulfobulbus sp.]|nr:MAG: 8-amino-7-oxononanoate synthase [Desulfobulbus sp.]